MYIPATLRTPCCGPMTCRAGRMILGYSFVIPEMSASTRPMASMAQPK